MQSGAAVRGTVLGGAVARGTLVGRAPAPSVSGIVAAGILKRAAFRPACGMYLARVASGTMSVSSHASFESEFLYSGSSAFTEDHCIAHTSCTQDFMYLIPFCEKLVQCVAVVRTAKPGMYFRVSSHFPRPTVRKR